MPKRRWRSLVGDCGRLRDVSRGLSSERSLAALVGSSAVFEDGLRAVLGWAMTGRIGRGFHLEFLRSRELGELLSSPVESSFFMVSDGTLNGAGRRLPSDLELPAAAEDGWDDGDCCCGWRPFRGG